jgi:hypothetical protein
MLNKIDINDYKDAGYPQPEAVKFDASKPRLDLVDFEALEGLAKVLTFGAQKYAANNWRNGFEYSRVIAALMRHLSAIQKGEDTDPESGLPHIDHLGCCWMFLSNLMKTRPELDDRWKKRNDKQSKTGVVNSRRGEFGCVYGSCLQPGESKQPCYCAQITGVPSKA